MILPANSPDQFVFIETISDKCQSHSTPSFGGRY